MTTVENMFIIRLRSRYFYKPFTASASCSNACVRMLRGVLLVHMLVVKDQLFQSLWSLVISHFRFWERKSVLYIFIQRAILGYYCLTGENGLTVVCLFFVSMQSTCALRWYLVCVIGTHGINVSRHATLFHNCHGKRFVQATLHALLGYTDSRGRFETPSQ